MTWSYSGDPSTSVRDEVRFYLQDVLEDRPLLQDEDIDYVASTWADVHDSPVWFAAVCAEIVAGRYAHEVSVSGDGVSVGASELQQKYKTLAEDLREQDKELTGKDMSDGLVRVFSTAHDHSLPDTMFGLRGHDNRRAGRQDYGGQDQLFYLYDDDRPEAAR